VLREGKGEGELLRGTVCPNRKIRGAAGRRNLQSAVHAIRMAREVKVGKRSPLPEGEGLG